MPRGSRLLQSLETFSVDVNQALHTNLLRLNAHKNTFSPINKLPPEVLGRIFETYLSTRHRPPPRQAVWYDDLILVCTWWYNVATKCPRMWYHIVGDHMVDRDLAMISTTRNHPRAVLRRSGETPLHLYMAWVIKNKPFRVEAPHITLRDAPRQYEALLELLATQFPSLRLLTVDAHYSSYSGQAVPQGMPIILCGEVSKLEALIWSVGVLFLPGNTFPSLAHLNLHQLASDARNLDNLLRLLSNCPRLETLVFAQSSLDVVTGMGPDRDPVPLKHFRALWVHGPYLAMNSALTFLSYLELPKDATVRLSNLSEPDPDDPSEQTEPPTSLPFLAQMDRPTRLDIIHCEGEYGDNGLHAFHFVVVGPRSRFWLHLPGSSTVAFHYLTLLYQMLPKETIETVRVSVITMRTFAFLPVILGHLPSLTTLLIRHSTRSSTVADEAGIVALVRALLVADVPAPRLKDVGLELTFNPGGSLEPFVRAIEDRKQCGHPLATVWDNIIGVNRRDVDEMKEHVVEGVSEVHAPLWTPTIDEGWRVKNDYWRLHPTPWDDLSGWGFYMEEW
ncbi:hypothetical protein V8D89_006947 [Ganoderma adspersum]